MAGFCCSLNNAIKLRLPLKHTPSVEHKYLMLINKTDMVNLKSNH